MSVYGSSNSSGNSIFGPGLGGINPILDEKFIDTEEIKAYVASVGLATAINNITPVSTLTTLCNVSESQVLTGQKTFSNGLNASNITLTGTNANGDLILYPRGTSPGHTREIEFKELAANGDHHVSLKASDAIPSTYTLTLPPDQPATTSLLASTTAGVMSWEPINTYAKLSGNQTFNGQSVFNNSSGSNSIIVGASKSIGFTNPAASATVSVLAGANPSSYTLTLPDALPSTQSLLSCSSTGALSFGNPVGLRLSGTGTADQADLILDPYGSTTRAIRFQEVAANGSNHIALRAPASLAANSVFELPILPTTASSLLSSSTAGVMGWTNPGTFVQTTTNQTIGGDKTFSNNLILSGAGAAANLTSITLFPYGTAAGETRHLRFVELAANGTNVAALRAPDSIASDFVLTLPNALPTTAGSLLTSSTTGVLSYTNPSTFFPASGGTVTGLSAFNNGITATASSPEAITLSSGKAIMFIESGTNAFTASIRAPAMTSSYTWNLPTQVSPHANGLIGCNTSGTLSYTNAANFAVVGSAQTFSATQTYTAGVISNQYLSGITSSAYPVDIVQSVNSGNARIEIQNTSSGASASSGIRIMADTANAADISLASSGNTTEVTNCLNIKNTAGDVRIFSAPATSASITVQASTGNVGILDTAPTQALSVTGSAQISSSLFLFGSNAQLVSGAASSTYSAHFQRTIQGDHTLNVQNNATGNSSARSLLRLGMGASGPNGEVSVHSNVHTTQPNHMIVKNNTSAGNIRLQAGSSTTFMTILNTSNNVGLNVDTPTFLLQLNTDSAAKPTSSTWTISSDERLKTDIQDADLDICYDNIKKIPLRRYKWKPEVYDKTQINDDWRRVGFIAQEYQKFFPKDVTQHHFQRTHQEPAIEVDEDGKETKTTKTVVDFELKDCLSINTDQILTTLVGAVKKIQEILDNQAESSDYTVSPMQMQISEGYGIVSNSIKHFNHKNVATLSFNFIVDDDVTATEWLELPLLTECKSVMLSNVVYVDEHGYDSDRPFKIALSKSIDKLKVNFKNLNAVEKNIQKKLLINYIIQ